VNAPAGGGPEEAAMASRDAVMSVAPRR